MISIRRRLLAGTVLTVAASTGLASAGAWLSVRAHLGTVTQEGLRADASRLLAQLRSRGPGLHWAGQGPGGGAPAFDGWWVVLDAGGAVVLASTPDAGALAAAADGCAALPDGAAGRVARASGAVAGPGRQPRPGAEATVVVARSEAGPAATLAAVATALGSAAAAATLLAAAAAVLLARAVVRPVDRLAAAIAAARPDDPGIALPPAAVPRELHAVVARSEAFLVAARDLLARERRTAASIAHELRTPLAGLAATIEMALARERAAADYRQALARCRVVVDGATALVDRLLLLTRLESGREPVRRATVDLDAALRDACTIQAEEADAREVALPAPPLLPSVAGDAGHLDLVLRNLLGNAVAHAPAGSALEFAAVAGAAAVALHLTNPAGGLTAADLPRLEEPFWRGDPARAGTGRHAGLGLALCRRLCALNGWRLELAVADGRFTAVLTLPLATAQ